MRTRLYTPFRHVCPTTIMFKLLPTTSNPAILLPISDASATPVNADVGVGSFPGSLLLFVVVEGRGLVAEGDGGDCDGH